MAAFPLPLRHVSQRGEASPAPHHDLGPMQGTADGPDAPVDLLPHQLPMFLSQGVGPDQALGDSDRTQRQRVNLVDDGAGRENYLYTPAAYIYHRGGAPLEVEMAGGAGGRPLSLFLPGGYVYTEL